MPDTSTIPFATDFMLELSNCLTQILSKYLDGLCVLRSNFADLVTPNCLHRLYVNSQTV